VVCTALCLLTDTAPSNDPQSFTTPHLWQVTHHSCYFSLCVCVHVSCSDRVLMVPFPKGTQQWQDVWADRSEWMLLGRNQISPDGRDCDRVRLC
jgi:hypothetical protein